jgi:hypothetical protein
MLLRKYCDTAVYGKKSSQGHRLLKKLSQSPMSRNLTTASLSKPASDIFHSVKPALLRPCSGMHFFAFLTFF